MSSAFSRLIAVVASFFIFSAAWFCLWSISLHLVERPELAVLLFPFGLRLGLMLQCPRGYWPVLLGAEWLMLVWLAQEVALAHLPLLMTGSLLTLLPVALISRYRHQRDWRTLLRQGAALIAAALLQSLPWVGEKEMLNALLLALTGGLTLAPTCLVFWHYLTSTVWQPLGPALVTQPVNWRARHLIWYLLLFVVSLWLQLGLPAELSRFTPFCLALPIIALAWHYGWQGALIATLMNAIALIASQTWHDHPVDLLLSLLAQSLTGLLLGSHSAPARAEPVSADRTGAQPSSGGASAGDGRERAAGGRPRAARRYRPDHHRHSHPGGYCPAPGGRKRGREAGRGAYRTALAGRL